MKRISELKPRHFWTEEEIINASHDKTYLSMMTKAKNALAKAGGESEVE